MKLIILAAGKSSSISTHSEAPPVCLNQFDYQDRIIDRTIALGQKLSVKQPVLVGGYRLLDILKLYPDIKYYYNDKWEKTGSLSSLLEAAAEFTDDLVISYSDVVHRMNVAESLTNSSSDVVVTYDSKWMYRYEGRTQKAMHSAEVMLLRPEQGYSILKGSEVGMIRPKLQESLLGEFTGLLFVRKAIAQKLSTIIPELLAQNPNAGIEKLIEALTHNYLNHEAVDVYGNWAELDSETDLEQFKFGTKAETLSKLEGILEHGHILPQVMLSVEEWKMSRAEVIQNIQDTFGRNLSVVIRSSGINEDTAWSSMAGNFESVLNVPTNNSDLLATAIDRVNNSFMKDGMQQIDANQVLIQPMLDQAVVAGVVFTEDLETSAPYYVINYDESGSTQSITSGSTNEYHTQVVSKKSAHKIKDEKISALLKSIREIEEVTGYNSLDIEFAIRMEQKAGVRVPCVYILQVRPIAAQKDKLRVSRFDVEAELDAIAKYIRTDKATDSILCGKNVAYGVMPDWNPAEIIGINPRPLAFSLYRYLITDQTWGKSRQMCGYRSTSPRPGIISFGGKPYVDVRMSFTSFTPDALPKTLADRLVEYAVDRLKQQPERHDKVEFGVMPTAFDTNFSATVGALLKNGFSHEECSQISESYKTLTNDIINGVKISVDSELEKITELKKIREQASAMILRDGVSWSAVAHLLDHCRQSGTLPFSNLARFGFIGIIQLKGLVACGALTQKRLDAFMASIQTVAKDFVNDLATLEREELIKLYGHLRPGTYDVRCPAYHENFDAYVDLSNRPKIEKLSKFFLTKEEDIAIRSALDEVGIASEPDALFNFIRKAVIGRERSKFEFTKNLSLALDYIVKISNKLGFDRDALSYLQIEDLLSNAYRSLPSNTKHTWHSLINRRRREHIITSSIKLPELITQEADLEYFFLSQAKPNYVTQTSITAPVLWVTGPGADIDGKICLIMNADPGFDWIFSHKIAGLITAYGGANSHMAIRCAEFEIPAAIGSGEAIFNSLQKASSVRLDCAAMRIDLMRSL